MNSHKQERGGVVSFIIITLALAGLLAGGLYLSKHQARSARTDNVPAVTVTEPTNSSEEKGETNSATQQKSDAKDTSSNSTGHTSSVATTGPSTVAASGPSDVFVTGAGLMVLTGSLYAFSSSRRSLIRSALSN